MSYPNYEEYMRSVLGYQNNFNTYPMYYDYDNSNSRMDVNSLYPEIYHEINPLVENSCMKYKNVRLTNDIIEEITDDVYNKCNSARSENKRVENKMQKNSTETETRNRPNNYLRDLIKILIIKNLLGNNNHNRPQNRPPMMPGGMMPGYPNYGGRKLYDVKNS